MVVLCQTDSVFRTSHPLRPDAEPALNHVVPNKATLDKECARKKRKMTALKVQGVQG